LDHIADYIRFLSNAQSFWFTLDTSYDYGCHLASRFHLNPEEYEALFIVAQSGRRWQHGGGIGIAVAASAARWQRRQKQNSSSSAEVSTAETATAARRRRWQCKGSGVSTMAVVTVAAAPQRQ
jgi:hypothetical protein